MMYLGESFISLRSFMHTYWRHIIAMTLITFGLRCALFTGFMAPYYVQPDTQEYYNLSVGILAGFPPCTSEAGEPIFWRTPGYPWFVARVYGVCRALQCCANFKEATHVVLWVQMIICSLLPLLSLILAWVLTRTVYVALITGWIAAFHLGFILSSMHLQTDGLSLVFWIAFLGLFYAAVSFRRELAGVLSLACIAGSACMLGIYTWMRPMGLFVMQLSAGITLVSKGSWKIKAAKIFIFVGLFFAIIGAWYMRNYRLTGRWFYNPTWGVTLIAYAVPKLIMRETGKSYDESLYLAKLVSHHAITQEYQRLRAQGLERTMVREHVQEAAAWPLVKHNPLGFAADWSVQIIKTMFDLYTALLVACVKKVQDHDDLQEQLLTKVGECLWTYPLPLWMRVLAWIELLWLLGMWIGFFAGCAAFLVLPFFWQAIPFRAYALFIRPLWLEVGIMIGGLLAMTGANGYARLRLPADILIIILSLTFWWWLVQVIRQRSAFRA